MPKRFSRCREERNRFMFNESEQKAIEEKLEQLRRVKDGTLTPQELEEFYGLKKIKMLFYQNIMDCQMKKKHTELYFLTI